MWRAGTDYYYSLQLNYSYGDSVDSHNDPTWIHLQHNNITTKTLRLYAAISHIHLSSRFEMSKHIKLITNSAFYEQRASEQISSLMFIAFSIWKHCPAPITRDSSSALSGDKIVCLSSAEDTMTQVYMETSPLHNQAVIMCITAWRAFILETLNDSLGRNHLI